MPTHEVLTDAQRIRFETIPDMDVRELARHYTLSEADLNSISVRRGVANRLGFAVQLCMLSLDPPFDRRDGARGRRVAG